MTMRHMGRMREAVNDFLKATLGWIPARVALGVMSWLGFMNLYMVRTNLYVTIVAMVKRNISSSAVAPCIAMQKAMTGDDLTNLTESSDLSIITQEDTEGEMDWNETTQGLILASFFYGYACTQVIGGRLSELYGARWVFGGCILAGGMSAILTPVAARAHYGLLIALRVIQGLFQGVAFPCMHALLTRWIPPLERPRFVGIVCMGTNLSACFTMSLCGAIIDAFGWATAFYVTGLISLLWCVMWFSFMYNTPSEHPRISHKELQYIEMAIQKSGTSSRTPKKIPWFQILTSLPAMSLLICSLGNGWGLSILFAQLPTYMKNVLGFSIKENGALSGLPFLLRYAGTITWSSLCDYLLKKNCLSILAARRIFSALGLIGPGLMVLIVSFSGCSRIAVLSLICIGLFLNGAAAASYFVNHTDIAPNFAGTLMGLSNTCGSIVSFIAPVVVGVMTDNQQTLGQWQKVFWTAVPIYIVPEIFFLVFASGSIQPWNFDHNDQGVHKNTGDDLKEEEKEALNPSLNKIQNS